MAVEILIMQQASNENAHFTEIFVNIKNNIIRRPYTWVLSLKLSYKRTVDRTSSENSHLLRPTAAVEITQWCVSS